MSKSNEKLVQNTLKILERDFIVVGKTRVRSWHAWLAIGLAAGITAGILFVANRSGEFETGMAASSIEVTASLLGQTGENFVDEIKAFPGGGSDVHIRLTGVTGTTLSGVRITGPSGGTWETPYNGTNWIVVIKPQASDPSTIDLYFSFWKNYTSYTLNLTFADGSTKTVQTVNRIIPAALVVVGDPSHGPYGVEANINIPEDVMVRFLVDGREVRIENAVPYSLFGDDGSTVFTGTLGAGTHTIVANVYDQGTTNLRATTQIIVNEAPTAPPPPLPTPALTPTPTPTPTPPPVQPPTPPLPTPTPTPTPLSTKFQIGDRVQVTILINVRQTEGGTKLGTQPQGALGTVVGGPKYAILTGTSNYYWWWQINYDNAPDGWSGEDYLSKYVAPPVITPTPTPTPFGSAKTSQLWGNNGELWNPNGILKDYSKVGYRNGSPVPYKQRQATKTFGEGRFTITSPIRITSGVLRGAGKDKTILYFPQGLDGMGTFDCDGIDRHICNHDRAVIEGTGSEIGIEDLTLEFGPHGFEHTWDMGYGGVTLYDCTDCWVKNVKVVNATDAFRIAGGSHNTLDGVETANADHWAIATWNTRDNLITNFNAPSNWHGVGGNWATRHTAYTNGITNRVEATHNCPDCGSPAADQYATQEMLFSNIQGNPEIVQYFAKYNHVLWNVGNTNYCPLDIRAGQIDYFKSIKTCGAGAVTPTPISTKFQIGDRIQTTAAVNVRQSAAGNLLGQQQTSALGTVIAGPALANLNGINYWWWNINYDNALDGWSAEDYLKKY